MYEAMSKIHLISLLILFTILPIFGQQDAQYTMYTHNMNVINPAYAGSKETLSIGLLGRTQWVGFEDAPKTFTANINAPVWERLGLGFSVIADKIGVVNEQNIYTDLSYSLPVGEKSKLALGIKGGISLLSIGDDIILPDTEVSEDPVFQNNENKFYPNFGAGLFFYTDKFYTGFSIPNFLSSTYYESSGNDNQPIAKELMHGFFTMGYVFTVNDNLKFKPATMVKAAMGAPLSIDLSANFLYKEKVEMGLNYRWDDSIAASFLLNAFDQFRVGYAYDYTLSDLGSYNSGSHEILFLWDIFTNNVVVSPRFF
jgi:type IX secretion system PorP/SprF family membrane protein